MLQNRKLIMLQNLFFSSEIRNFVFNRFTLKRELMSRAVSWATPTPAPPSRCPPTASVSSPVALKKLKFVRIFLKIIMPQLSKLYWKSWIPLQIHIIFARFAGRLHPHVARQWDGDRDRQLQKGQRAARTEPWLRQRCGIQNHQVHLAWAFHPQVRPVHRWVDDRLRHPGHSSRWWKKKLTNKI